MKKLLILLISILLYGQIFGQLNVKTRKFNSGGANVFDTLSLGSYCFIQAADSAWIEKPKGTWFASLTQGGGTTNYIGNDYLRLPGDGTAKNKFVIDLDRGNENAGWYYYWLNTAETWGLYMHLDATGYGFAGLGSEEAWSQVFTIDPVDELDNMYSIAINSATGTNGNFYINNDGAYFQKGIQLNYEEDAATLEVSGYVRYDPVTGIFEGYNGISSSWTNFGGEFKDIIYVDLLTAISGSTLSEGTYYRVSDRGDRWLLFQAVSTNQLAIDGQRLMLCPADYAIETDAYSNVWIGVWNPTKDPDIGDLTIWGGMVWESVTGNIGTASDEITLDLINWVVIPKTSFANHEYVEMLFGVQYDWTNDYCVKQWDRHDNIFVYNSDIDYASNCDISDWNFATSGNALYSNHCRGIYNNSNNGEISNNFCNNMIGTSGEISNNSNNGEISNNFCNDITDNSNNGKISNNFIKGYIGENSNDGSIEYNKNNGNIYYVSSPGYACDVKYNVNNGYISGVKTADVTDAIVNK